MASPTDLQTFAERGFPDRRAVNGALKGARNATMLALIGNPRSTYDDKCREPDSARIESFMVSDDMGPFNVRGLGPAVQTLKLIMQDIRVEQPALFDRLSSAGMLCCRLVRGSTSAISNHSWGAAIDLKIDGKLDEQGNGMAQSGLFDIHPIFNRHGFFWGAAFGTEDAMHFEASDQLIRRWSAAGLFGAAGGGVPAGMTLGDRGPQVEALQIALNDALAPQAIEIDGIFGRHTRAAVVEFQRRHGIAADGIAGARVRKALGLTG